MLILISDSSFLAQPYMNERVTCDMARKKVYFLTAKLRNLNFQNSIPPALQVSWAGMTRAAPCPVELTRTPTAPC